MFRHFGALLSLTILLVLVPAESSSLNCENLDAVTCKQRFKEQIEQKIKNLSVETYKEELILKRNLYLKILEDLPENNKFIEPLRHHLSNIDKTIPKLSQDITVEGMMEIIMPTNDPEDPLLNFDYDLRKEYEDFILKHVTEEFETAILNMKKKINEKMTEAWKELFAQLRPVDLAAYSDYEKLSTELKNSTFNNSGEVWNKIKTFLA